MKKSLLSALLLLELIETDYLGAYYLRIWVMLCATPNTSVCKAHWGWCLEGER